LARTSRTSSPRDALYLADGGKRVLNHSGEVVPRRRHRRGHVVVAAGHQQSTKASRHCQRQQAGPFATWKCTRGWSGCRQSRGVQQPHSPQRGCARRRRGVQRPHGPQRQRPENRSQPGNYPCHSTSQKSDELVRATSRTCRSSDSRVVVVKVGVATSSFCWSGTQQFATEVLCGASNTPSDKARCCDKVITM